MIDVQNASMTVSQVTNILASAYSKLINSGVSLRRFPSVMLWGSPGVGKSQGVRQLAVDIGACTGKRVEITDVRLLLFNPVDLRGIPTANEEKTLAVWLKPKIFQMDDSIDVINILFLDEISAAPQSVQAAAYQITLDRTVGEHRLPENCIVIAAGNRVTDRSVAYNMPKALANRLCHFEIKTDINSWREWAIESGINECVIGFLDYKPSLLMDFDTDSSEHAFPTPRSWEMVSNILNYINSDINEVYSLIAGCVGSYAANELLWWNNIYSTAPSAEDIFSGEEQSVPLRPESLYALSTCISTYARNHHSTEETENAITYVNRLPSEFRDRIFADFLRINSVLRTLYNNRIYNDWFEQSGHHWEDYGL